MPLAANSKHRNSMDGPPPDQKSSLPDGGAAVASAGAPAPAIDTKSNDFGASPKHADTKSGGETELVQTNTGGVTVVVKAAGGAVGATAAAAAETDPMSACSGVGSGIGSSDVAPSVGDTNRRRSSTAPPAPPVGAESPTAAAAPQPPQPAAAS